MLRRFHIVLLLLLFGGCTSVTEPPASGDLLPLSVGNQWRYARTRYYRGTLVERDTMTVTIKSKGERNSRPLFETEVYNNYELFTYYITRFSDSKFGVIADPYMGSAEFPFIDFTLGSEIALFLHTSSLHSQNQKFSSGADTTFLNLPAKRILEEDELVDDNGYVQLRLNFEHTFVPGIGQVAARFIADLTQCQRCSLASEFWTYELIDYHLQ